MAEERICPECGKPIPEGAPEGLCPACLWKRGLEKEEPEPPGDARRGRPLERDRNLLFGVFAVQLGFVRQEKFIETAAAWATDPARGLPERMESMGILTPPKRQMLERLVDEAIREARGDAGESLKFFGGEERISRMLARAAEGKLLSTRLGLPLAIEDAPVDVEKVLALDEQPGRYTRKSEHSRGGMGRILLVYDEYLMREVALKELLPRDAEKRLEAKTPVRLSGDMVVRFLREAKLTGQLEHPSIVPVYELGRGESGSLYYTMKLVRGRTFARALFEAKSIEERLKLLPHFLDLCQAVAYAHSRGVIHRDLKPANVMIGEFGETVVIDWGLAKVIDREDPYAEQIRKSIHAFRGEQINGTKETSAGERLGTPDYMSPEQAKGQIDAIDERSDVFSLGVFLYELLTGAVPFESDTAQETLEKVIVSPPQPIHLHERHAPPELVSICLKALEKDKARRYQTAADLAADIERFQTGAFVRSYEYNVWEVARRYYRRHRAALNTAAAGLVALAGFGVWSYLNIREARDEALESRNAAVQARDREEIARDRAERENYRSQLMLVQSQMNANSYPVATRTLWNTSEAHRNWEWGYLLNQCSLETRTLEGFTVAAMNPDGTRLATLGRFKPITIWNTEDWTVVKTIPGTERSLHGLSYSPDGTKLMGPALDRTIRIFDAGSGSLVRTFHGHRDMVGRAVYDGAGERILSVSKDTTARIWDAATGKELVRFGLHQDGLWRALFSPDGARVLSLSDDGMGKIWDANTGEEIHSFPARTAAFSPDGRLVASAETIAVTVWDAETAAPVAIMPGHTAVIDDVRFNPDGTLVASGSQDGAARIWEASTGRLIHTLMHGPAVHHVRFSGDGELIVTKSIDGRIKVWDTKTGHEINSIAGHANYTWTAEFTPDNQFIVSTSLDQTVKLWNARVPYGQRILAQGTNGFRDFTLSDDGRRIALLTGDNTLDLLDAETGRLFMSFTSYNYYPQRCVDFSPDGKRIVAALDQFTPMVFDLESLDAVSMFMGQTGEVYSVDFSPDGKHVVSTGWDWSGRIWDANTGEQVQTLDGHESWLTAARYSPDGRRILTGGDDGEVKLWDAATGKELRTLRGHTAAVNHIVFSPDGKRALTASNDATARLWDVSTGGELAVYSSHAKGVASAMFGSDGSRVITAGREGTVRVWELATGAELLSFPLSGVKGALFGAGGKTLYAMQDSGVLRRIDPAPWRTDDLPGGSDLPPAERFALYKSQNAGTKPVSGTIEGPPPLVIVTTPEMLADRFKRFADAVENDAAADEGPGVLITEGPRRDALARLCFLEGDRLVRVDGRDARGAPDIFREIAHSAHSGSIAPISLEIIRRDVRRPVRILVQPRANLEGTVTIDRPLLREMIEYQATLLRTNPDSWIKTARKQAAAMGEVLAPLDGINGIWFTDDNAEPIAREYIRAVQLTRHYRMTELNGMRVVEYAAVSELLEKEAAKLAAGEQTSLTITMELGEFMNWKRTLASR